MTTNNQNEDVEITEGEELLFGIHLGSLEGSTMPEEDDHNNQHKEVEESIGHIPHTDDGTRNMVHPIERLCQFEDTLPLASEEDFVNIFQWATEEGAELEGMACQTDGYGGRGLFATVPVTTGGVLAMLPRSLRWGQRFAVQTLRSSEGGGGEGIVVAPDTPDLTALSLLVLQLCREEHVYAKCLPRQGQFTNAILMSASEAAAWGDIDPVYADALRRVQSIGEGCQGYIQHVLLAPDEDTAAVSNGNNHNADNDLRDRFPSLPWAMSMVKSRSHAFGSKRGYWLTPVLDLVNHSIEPNAMLVGGDEGQLLLKALAPIGKGEEIKIDYQVDDDAMLLASYGFSLLYS